MMELVGCAVLCMTTVLLLWLHARPKPTSPTTPALPTLPTGTLPSLPPATRLLRYYEVELPPQYETAVLCGLQPTMLGVSPPHNERGPQVRGTSFRVCCHWEQLWGTHCRYCEEQTNCVALIADTVKSKPTMWHSLPIL
jgi:hypothetical protein